MTAFYAGQDIAITDVAVMSATAFARAPAAVAEGASGAGLTLRLPQFAGAGAPVLASTTAAVADTSGVATRIVVGAGGLAAPSILPETDLATGMGGNILHISWKWGPPGRTAGSGRMHSRQQTQIRDLQGKLETLQEQNSALRKKYSETKAKYSETKAVNKRVLKQFGYASPADGKILDAISEGRVSELYMVENKCSHGLHPRFGPVIYVHGVGYTRIDGLWIELSNALELPSRY